jgi:hypothetical protein
MLYDAMDMTLSGLVVVGPSPQDGIHFDGSFTQHSGLLYNGNYGKDLINAFVQLESETLWTNYGANSTYQEAFTTLMGGSEWMVFLDSETGQLHWDYNVIGRFVAFATEDQQASADVNINKAKLSDAVANFANLDVMYDVMDRMGSNFSKPLHGNRAFPASDYMVHRGEGFVLGNKLLSTRTNSTECTNSANIDGYHMGHGTLFAYGSGHEYVDIMGQWDWNLIPGTTVLLGEPDVIDVECANVAQSGTRTAVGVVSDGTLGMSMMDYHDEVADLSFRKSWAFFGDRVVVTVTKVETGSDKPLITVLDNRRSADSKVPVVDGAATHNAEQNAKSVFYDNKGYVANTEFELTMEDVWREGNWSVISTSTQGVQSAPIWSAYTVTPKDFFSYTFFPNTDLDTVLAEADAPSTEIFDDDHLHHGVKFGDNYAVAFFETGTAWYKGENYSIAIGSSDPALVLAHDNGSDEVQLSVSDPTQSLDKLVITITRCNSRYCKSGNVDIELPKTGETVSGSVSYDLSS